MRPPAIHQVYQICPDDIIVLVFGDGSIYEYSDFRTPVEAVIAAFIHGRKFNAPGFRRPKYPRFTGPYERLEEVPEGALLVYEEPPYRATEEPAVCEVLPSIIYFDDAWNTWSQEAAGCTLGQMNFEDENNYSGGGCQGPAFLTNFGPFWQLSWNWGAGEQDFESDGTSIFGPYNLVTPLFVPPFPPEDWFFLEDPP